MNEAAKFCVYCGASKDGTVAETAAVAVEHGGILKTKKAKIIAIALACVVAVVGAFFLVRADSKYTSPEAVATDFIVAEHTMDAEKLVNCLPDFAVYRMYGTDRKGAIAMLKDYTSSAPKSECTVLSATRVYNDSKLAEYTRNIESYGVTSADRAKIEDYALVQVKSQINGYNKNTVVVCIKLDGGWYVLDVV